MLRSLIYLSFLIIFAIYPSAIFSGTLFDGELLPSERAAMMEQSEVQIESVQRSLGAIEEMEVILLIQPLKRGDCAGFARMETQASDGDAQNQYLVGAAFLNGWCVAQDLDMGLDWMARAANAEFDLAAVDYAMNVFRILEQGEQVSRSKQSTAVELLTAAADRHNAESNSLLGFLYLNGTVVPKDVRLAEEYLIEAAIGGNDDAIYTLGRLLVEQERFETSLEWFRFGATKGLAINQIMLAAVLSDTAGSDGYVEAYKWANIAAANAGQDEWVAAAADMRERLAEVMTPEQIGEAQALSSSFEANPYVEAPFADERRATHEYSYDELVDPTATPMQIAAREQLKRMNIPINRMAFFNAIAEDNIELVKTFVRAGSSLETPGIGVTAPWGATPLYVAVDWGAEKTFRYLMEQDVELDTAVVETGHTPLVRALAHERYDWAIELLDAGADASMQGDPADSLLSFSALSFAVGTERVDLVKRILDQGGSVDERYSSHMTPLQNAIAFDGSTEVIKLLLDEGADPNAVGNFETMLDATFGDESRSVRTDAMALLLEYGADPEVSEVMGGSPLMAAAAVGSPRAIRMLVDAGADPNRSVSMDDGEIPMIYDDPVERDILRSGTTALAIAALMGNIGAAVTLIDLGADTDFIVNGDTGRYSITDLAARAGVTIPGL